MVKQGAAVRCYIRQRVQVVYADESIWLTQKMMGMLYDGNVRTANEHLKKSLPTASYRKIQLSGSSG